MPIKKISKNCNNVHLIFKILYLNPREKLAKAKWAILIRRPTYHEIETSWKGINTWIAVCVVQSPNENPPANRLVGRGKKRPDVCNGPMCYEGFEIRDPDVLRNCNVYNCIRCGGGGKNTKSDAFARMGKKKKTTDRRRAMFCYHCCWLDKTGLN